ncbi:MRC1-like domain-containing protein [Exophiala viscosa]|uniref:MRC1-like domain-containing protein n=1 Tax=Exophiala viscosa TaxID=2486360 RepID=A0AAN6DNZ7_9EURO|nr:MRC1-like domain-containing protein [Exophiala viscosa]KAI1620869.1 MRC1-like domain-containing protein [Exophiala viscosa]
MSSPHRSPFSPGSPRSPASNVLTPSRKVQALLAQFDDSDSDTSLHGQGVSSVPKKVEVAKSRSVHERDASEAEQDDSEEEDDLPVAPRSKMAARLQGTFTQPASVKSAEGRSTSHLLSPAPLTDSDDGGVAELGMRRNLLTKRKTSPGQDTPQGSTSRRSPSVSITSPNPLGRGATSTPSDSEDGENQNNKGKSKFLALVEKHRKQRLEKEAEEEVKRNARLETLKSQAKKSGQQRGSSPADDSDEESDISENDGAKKLSTQARPTRKASKKAVEEMKRETQRISRNMQLAHQARTKKKITKDSLLARFNFHIATSASRTGEAGGNEEVTTSSSRAASDAESLKDHDTPPTSPIPEDSSVHGSKIAAPHPVTAMHAVENDDDLPSLHELATRIDKGKGRAPSEVPISRPVIARPAIMQSGPAMGEDLLADTLKPTIKPLGIKRPAIIASKPGDDDSDSDLEVITSKGDIRKFAVFEHLPKRKAKEAPSHLALRSLAHLIGGDDRKRSLNAAEMEVSLRRQARLQARQERQNKIEELKAKGVFIQTAEEREQEQEDVEDLVEKARQEAAEIHKREKALAKKEGNYTKDGLDDDDSDEDEDFQDDAEGGDSGVSDDEDEEHEEEDGSEGEESLHGSRDDGKLVDDQADEEDSEASGSAESEAENAASDHESVHDTHAYASNAPSRPKRVTRVLSDDEDEEVPNHNLSSPQLPANAKTPVSVARSAKKQIPGLQMSDDLPIGLTQAFAATMADSQSQSMANEQEQDSLAMTMDLPSPNIAMVPRLQRMESIDVISDSQPTTETQPLNIDLSFTQSQNVPQSPAIGLGMSGPQFTPSQQHFEPTQDGGYMLSPFKGNRFASETPLTAGPRSTIDTVVLPNDTQESPVVQRRAKLRRGRAPSADSDEDIVERADTSAFEIMRRAAKNKDTNAFDKTKSNAREIVDDAAEESEDEYAGLGGASDEEGNDEEDEHDRAMIDEDTQVGLGDEAKLAKFHADREVQDDAKDVSKLYKDITTGAYRRKRGNDDLDLSDEEDAASRRREAKKREFAKMRRELLKDEAVGRIAEDRRKEAFLRSIEDREVSDDEGIDMSETQTAEEESQERPEQPVQPDSATTDDLAARKVKDARPLEAASDSRLNLSGRRTAGQLNKRPATLAEIRESVSFLIDEPDSQAATIDLGLSDSEEEPEAYLDLDRHFQADENADDGDDLGDFIVHDDGQARSDEQDTFKKPTIPYSETTGSRAPFSERRTKERTNVVNRLNMLRQASSSSSSSTSTGASASTKMAFYTATSSASVGVSFGKVPSLLRRATTNSSLGSMAGRDENVSATGVVTSNRTERGSAGDGKEFVRKGSGGRRNAVNYRPTMKEEKMSQRAGIAKKTVASKGKKRGSNFLGGLFRQDSWA